MGKKVQRRPVPEECVNLKGVLVQSSKWFGMGAVRHVSRISLREGPQLTGAPKLGGPKARGPKVRPIKKQMSADLVHYFLGGARFPINFLILTI